MHSKYLRLRRFLAGLGTAAVMLVGGAAQGVATA